MQMTCPKGVIMFFIYCPTHGNHELDKFFIVRLSFGLIVPGQSNGDVPLSARNPFLVTPQLFSNTRYTMIYRQYGLFDDTFI